MKTRLRDRLLVPIAGAVILLGVAALIAETYFGKHVTAFVGSYLARQSLRWKIAIGAAIALLLILAIYCIFFLFRRSNRRRDMVMQKREGGNLSISIKALETLIVKCIETHPEISCNHIYLHNERDGIVANIRCGVARGTNIPLVTDALQKQVRAYVTDCTGVDVKAVSLQVEELGDEESRAAYRVPDPVDTMAERVKNGAAQEAEAEKEIPLHQRLFSQDKPETAAEEPAVPAEPAAEPEAPGEVPAEENESPAKTAEESVAESVAEAVDETAEKAEAPVPTLDPADIDGKEDPMKADPMLGGPVPEAGDEEEIPS